MDSHEKPKILVTLAQNSCTAVAAGANSQVPCLGMYSPFCHRPHYSLLYTMCTLPVGPLHVFEFDTPGLHTWGPPVFSLVLIFYLSVPLTSLLVMPMGPNS